MVLLIILITLLFLFSTFFGNLSHAPLENVFLNYYFYQTEFVVSHVIAFVVGFFILTIIFFRFNFDKKYSVLRVLFFSSVQTVVIGAIGSFVAFVFLFVIAFLQLTMLSVIITINPHLMGIQTNSSVIAKSLKEHDQAPEIIASDTDKLLFAIATATSGANNFYGKYILQSIPHAIVVPVKNIDAAMLLLDNTLILTNITSQDMKIISPTVGYLFVREYFSNRQIKTDPTVLILSKDDYLLYRREDVEKKIVQIDKEIKKIAATISSVSAGLKNTQETLTTNEKSVNQQLLQGNTEYKKCLADSEKTNCQEIKSQWENKINQGNKNLNEQTEQIQQSQDLVESYTYYESFFKKQKELMSTTIEKISHEDGVFVPKNTIKIVITNTNPHAAADYFETLTHEYLHFVSYVAPDRRFESTFFEEGLTEYFARKITQQVLHVDTNQGYPVQVKIMSEMTKMISESEFVDIYFSKDEVSLEKALDRVYGDGFYEANRVLFETLQYSSDPKQTLKLANDIMQKIGGEKLTEKDLYSSQSKL